VSNKKAVCQLLPTDRKFLLYVRKNRHTNFTSSIRVKFKLTVSSPISAVFISGRGGKKVNSPSFVIMIVVCRNAKKRFDKPLFKWLWQN